jgi:hypothetical protein
LMGIEIQRRKDIVSWIKGIDKEDMEGCEHGIVQRDWNYGK